MRTSSAGIRATGAVAMELDDPGFHHSVLTAFQTFLDQQRIHRSKSWRALGT
jgi:hypothetical protein